MKCKHKLIVNCMALDVNDNECTWQQCVECNEIRYKKYN